MDKLQWMALWQAFRRTGYAEATIRYQILIGIDEIPSVRSLVTLLANLLAVVASRTLSSRHEQVASQTLEVLADNFVGNIEGNIVGKTIA